MTKQFHDARNGRKALAYGSANAIGPLADARHPRKLKLAPTDKKKPAASASNTDSGKEAQHDT